jgi:hypothetical protein
MTEVWEDVTFDDRPEYGPFCPSVNTHPWRLAIEEGKMILFSGCRDCDEAVLGPVGGEDVGMSIEIIGRLESHLDTIHCGWHSTEYDHWWEFVPERIDDTLT